MIYFVAHGIDVDGLCCHALAHKKFEDITHFYVDYPSLTKEFEKLIHLPKGKVIVADIAPNNIEELSKIIKKVGDKHELVGWYDHHDWRGGEEILSYFKDYKISKNECGAELVRKALELNDKDSELLTRIARASDYNMKKDKYYLTAIKLQKAISVANNKEENLDNITKALSKGKINHSMINKLSGEYDKIVREAKKKIDENLIIEEFKGLSVYAAKCEPILYMKEGARYILDEYSSADIALTVFPKGSVIVFSKTDKMNVVSYCQAHGGNGRGKGGGFILKKKKNLPKLIKKLSNYIN